MGTWLHNTKLREDLDKYVKQNIQRQEILDFVKRDFPFYKWSLRTLDRRLRSFNIYYTDTAITVGEAKVAVQYELNGPGRLLGYRAMHQKVRQKYDLKVPRHLVHNLMFDLAPEELEKRRPGQKHKKERTPFTTKGSD